MHVGYDGRRGEANAVKHETLFHNADVLAAGEIKVTNGVVVGLNDKSGSYRTMGRLQTDRRFARAILNAIDGAHAPLSDVERARLRGRAGI